MTIDLRPGRESERKHALAAAVAAAFQAGISPEDFDLLFRELAAVAGRGRVARKSGPAAAR